MISICLNTGPRQSCGRILLARFLVQKPRGVSLCWSQRSSTYHWTCCNCCCCYCCCCCCCCCCCFCCCCCCSFHGYWFSFLCFCLIYFCSLTFVEVPPGNVFSSPTSILSSTGSTTLWGSRRGEIIVNLFFVFLMFSNMVLICFLLVICSVNVFQYSFNMF